MKIWKRVCIKCKSRIGCKFVNRYGDIVIWSCDTCLLNNLGLDCLNESSNEIEVTGALCGKCYKKGRGDG